MIIDFYNRNGGGGSVPIATRDTAGIVKVGSGLDIDSGGTLSVSGGSADLPVKVLNISTATSGECMEFYNYAMSHHNESYAILYHLDEGDDGFAQATEITFDGNDSGIYLTFFTRSGKYVFGFWQGGTGIQIFNKNQLLSKPDSSEYGPFHKNLHLSSGGTLYFEDTEVNSGGTYDGILNIWGMLILVGAYQFINTHTGPFDTMLCPLYVDSSSTDSGRILMCPKVIDEPANVSIPGKELANHKVTLVYDEYKISWYQRGSQDWITGLTVTPIPKAVTSDYVSNIWKGTQAQYDALAPNYDNNTLYVIV